MKPSPGRITEQDKRRSRARHRQAIQSAYEEAKLCRRHYDEQRADGEIGDELYRDLEEAVFALYLELRPAVIDTKYEETITEIGDKIHAGRGADGPLRERDDVTPKTFASMIDRMGAVVVKSGLDKVEA